MGVSRAKRKRNSKKPCRFSGDWTRSDLTRADAGRRGRTRGNRRRRRGFGCDSKNDGVIILLLCTTCLAVLFPEDGWFNETCFAKSRRVVCDFQNYSPKTCVTRIGNVHTAICIWIYLRTRVCRHIGFNLFPAGAYNFSDSSRKILSFNSALPYSRTQISRSILVSYEKHTRLARVLALRAYVRQTHIIYTYVYSSVLHPNRIKTRESFAKIHRVRVCLLRG